MRALARRTTMVLLASSLAFSLVPSIHAEDPASIRLGARRDMGLSHVSNPAPCRQVRVGRGEEQARALPEIEAELRAQIELISHRGLPDE